MVAGMNVRKLAARFSLGLMSDGWRGFSGLLGREPQLVDTQSMMIYVGDWRENAQNQGFFGSGLGGFVLRGLGFGLKLAVRHRASAAFCRSLRPPPRTGARVVEWARLESGCAGNGTVGSNPTLSAISQMGDWVGFERSSTDPARSAEKTRAERGNHQGQRPIPPCPPFFTSGA